MTKHPWKGAKVDSQYTTYEKARYEADAKFKHTNKEYKVASRGSVYQIWVKK